MLTRTVTLLNCAWMLITCSAGAQSQPATAPADVTAAQVDAAIDAGLRFLYSKQAENGSWETEHAKRNRGGVEATVVLAALAAGGDPTAKHIKAALDYLQGLDPRTVHVRSLRASVYARLPQKDYADKLNADVAWLLKNQQPSGGWGYGLDDPTGRSAWTDAMNTSVAVMALHDAADAGATVPPIVWRKAKNWWLAFQNKDGGWGFDPPAGNAPALRPESYGSTTAAALLSVQLLSLHSAPYEAGPPRSPRKPNPPSAADRQALAKGTEWLASHYSLAAIPEYPAGLGDDYLLAYVYAMQRAAALAGVQELGGHVLQREIAANLVRRQRSEGMWTDTVVSAEQQDKPGAGIMPTAQAVLCLTQARLPVAVAWLPIGAEFDAVAAENAARALAKPLGYPVSWRKLSVKSLAQSRSPLVLMTWDGQATLDQELAEAIREYLAGGGFVMVQPLAGERKLSVQVQEFLVKAVPGLSAAKLAPEHAVLTLSPLPRAYKPALAGLSDFSGLRVVVAEEEFTGYWHIGRCQDGSAMLANMLRYSRDLAALESPLTERSAGAAKPASEVTVARVKAGDAWEAYPLAAARAGQALASGLSLGVSQAAAVDLAKDVAADVDLLWLPAAGKLTLNDAQRQTLRKYLQAGGTLFVDSAVGDAAAAEQALELARSLCGKDNVQELDAAHALLTGSVAAGSGCDLSKPTWTSILQQPGVAPERVTLHGGTINGRLAVVVCPHAVTAPAAGAAMYGCRGLAPVDARRLLCNVLLHAVR